MHMKLKIGGASAIAVIGLLASHPALAQEVEEEPRQTRVALGVQLVPSYPGSDDVSFRPLVDLARKRGDRPFEFKALDESFGFSVLRVEGLSVGPAINFVSSRSGSDVGADLPKIGFTVEAGAFAQYSLSKNVRVRAEVRRGLGGHDAWIGNLGADYIARKGDDWLFSVGPRVTIASERYQNAYFSVAPEDSVASGLPAYSAAGGVQSAGAIVGYLRRLSPRWGIHSFAKYDRLLGDAADSPIVRRFGSRDQISGGVALSYTFGPR